MSTEFVISADGTRIAYEIHGTEGMPTAVWVHGATVFRTP